MLSPGPLRGIERSAKCFGGGFECYRGNGVEGKMVLAGELRWTEKGAAMCRKEECRVSKIGPLCVKKGTAVCRKQGHCVIKKKIGFVRGPASGSGDAFPA